jgi:hypothetical protein
MESGLFVISDDTSLAFPVYLSLFLSYRPHKIARIKKITAKMPN